MLQQADKKNRFRAAHEMTTTTFRVTLKVIGDGVDPVAIGFVRVPLDASLQVVRAQAKEDMPGLPQYHFRLGGLGDAWEMRGSVPVAPHQEASEPAEDTCVYLALGPARKAVAHAEVFAACLAANDAPNPFVRGFARGVYAADYAAATKHAADAARMAGPLATARLSRRAVLGSGSGLANWSTGWLTNPKPAS